MEYVPSKMNFSLRIGDNRLIYEKTLTNRDETEKWGTLSITYTFYENAVKNEISLSNDWLPQGIPMKLTYPR